MPTRKIVWRKVWLAQIDGWLGFDYLKDLFTRLPAAKITQIKEFTPAAWVKTKAGPGFVQKAGANLPGKQNLL